MRSRYRIYDNGAIHFVTSTTVGWVPVFTHAGRFQILIDTFKFCQKSKGLKIYAFVILDNHFHLVMEAPDISGVMQSIKRHTARTIIDALGAGEMDEWLGAQLRFYRQKHKVESDHQLWQEGYHPQKIVGAEMLHQKIEYIHNNPVKRGLVDVPEHWRYSSARNYMSGDGSVLDIDEIG